MKGTASSPSRRQTRVVDQTLRRRQEFKPRSHLHSPAPSTSNPSFSAVDTSPSSLCRHPSSCACEEDEEENETKLKRRKTNTAWKGIKKKINKKLKKEPACREEEDKGQRKKEPAKEKKNDEGRNPRERR
jgi:hypothetical protein